MMRLILDVSSEKEGKYEFGGKYDASLDALLAASVEKLRRLLFEAPQLSDKIEVTFETGKVTIKPIGLILKDSGVDVLRQKYHLLLNSLTRDILRM